jgi:hypothetical protein
MADRQARLSARGPIRRPIRPKNGAAAPPGDRRACRDTGEKTGFVHAGESWYRGFLGSTADLALVRSGCPRI